MLTRVVLKPFYRITRRVDELSISLLPLFQKYCEPLNELESVPDGNTKRRLFSHIQPYLSAALNETFRVPLQRTSISNKEKIRRKGNMRKSGFGEACDELDFHMSVSAKYLLISAFLASRNPATLDAALFDSTGGSDNRKRKRRYAAFVLLVSPLSSSALYLPKLIVLLEFVSSFLDDVYCVVEPYH